MTMTLEAPRAQELRLGSRQSAKEAIAKNELNRDARREELAAISRLEAAIDGEVQKHATATEPIQFRLSEIQRLIIAAMVARQPVDPSLESERRELLAKLEADNRSLALSSAAFLDQIAAHRKAHDAIVIDPLAVEGALARADYADPQLFADHFGQQEVTKWLQAGVEALGKKVDEARDALTSTLAWNKQHPRAADYETQNILEARVKRWTAASNAAGRAVMASAAEEKRLWRAMIDE